MANDKATLAEALEEIEALREKLAAFEAFVRAEDAFNDLMDSGDWEGDDAAYHSMMAAREALRQYETLT